MEQDYQQKNLRDFLTVIFKHRSRILTVFLATVITVTVGSFLLPPTFDAASTLMVKFGREHIYRSEVDDARSSISFNREESINSEMEILKSRDLIEKVITTMGVEKIYPVLAKKTSKRISPLEAAILKFGKKLFVESVKKSNVIQVTFKHRDPQVAASAVNQLVEFFKEKHLEIYSDPKATFMEKQLAIYREKLEESETSLEDFKQKHGVFSIDEQRRLLLTQRVDLDTTLKNDENRAVELTKKLSSLQKQKKSVSKNVPLYRETERYQIIDDAKAKLLNLQLREQELLGKHRENNRLVVNVRKEIALVKAFLEDQEKTLKGKVRTGKNEVYQELEMQTVGSKTELDSIKAKIAAIKEQLSLLEKNIQNIDLRENELRNLERNLAINEVNFKTYLKKLEEARVTDDLNQEKMVSISVIQAASVPVKPTKPRKALNILLSIILGSVSGLGLAFSSEYLGQGISTPESAESRLGVPVLATFSYKEEKDETAGTHKKRGRSFFKKK